MNIKFCDQSPIGQMRSTTDGYLVTTSRVARTGVQDYLASELGLMGNHVVKVNRADGEVFSKDAMSSLSHAPVTVNHPVESVDADNWADLAVGEVGEGVLRDGEWLSVPLILKDAKGIDAATDTHKQISMGYTALLVDASPDADYDFEMTNIQFNHLALVPSARAGSKARIGDADNWGAAPQPQKEPVHMVDMKTIVVGDEAVQIAASDADKVTKLIANHKLEIESKDTVIGELKAENAETAKKVMTDAEIEAAVIDRMAIVAKAVTLVADYDATGKSLSTIKREAVASVYGDEAAIATVTDAEINGIFSVMKPAKVDDAAREALKKANPVTDGNPWAFLDKKGDK